jgi:hypothetical protein
MISGSGSIGNVLYHHAFRESRYLDRGEHPRLSHYPIFYQIRFYRNVITYFVKFLMPDSIFNVLLSAYLQG